MLKFYCALYVATWLAAFVPIFLVCAPWGATVDGLGFYFYRYNSGMTLKAPFSHVWIINWESGAVHAHRPWVDR